MTQSEEKLPSHIHTELMALQDLAVGDIRFYKEQQWKISNYGILLYAALNTTHQLIGSNITSNERTFIIVLTTIVLASGVCLIKEMSKPLAKGRDRLSVLRKYFDENISLKAYAAGEEPQIALQRSYEKVSLDWFFYGVFVVGYVFTIWLLIRVSCT